ncbi:MAG TPA: tRNA (adenosine(37)-N6)-threonylcarbamoyltransferase complex dimerization subunit type 1 TsaB [Acidimicrobiales bacterium]|nr:tRNA (adenosine(37)-N6)-threonylcarbamoyltransferase complex dimerization subunit type 1 TsaB [Acidimicrobiales bacterium]
MLLGIETAAGLVGVALADADGPLGGVWLRGERRHAETLAPAVAHVLAQAGASLADVDVVAVDVGPGLFTGLRVGVATAQGLAAGLGVGVLEVTSVDVLAGEAYHAGWEGPVAAVVDARRGEVFAALAAGPGGAVEAPSRHTPDALAATLRRTPRTLLVGTGAHRYAEVFRAAGLRVAGIREPSPRVLVALAAGRLAGGETPVPPAAVRPVYLREADARINWVQR